MGLRSEDGLHEGRGILINGGRKQCATVRKDRGTFGLWGKVLLGFLLAALLLVRFDTFNLTPARAVAKTHIFSLAQWEVLNLHRKWLHLLWETLPGKKPSREERLAILDEYLLTARLVQKEKDRLEGPQLGRSTTATSGAVTKGKAPASQEYLIELLKSKEKLRARAEEAIEAEMSAVVIEEGLGSRLGFLFPPIDIRFDQPPTMLVTSPRDRIQILEAVMLSPDIDALERDRLEKMILEDYNLSALVNDLAGLSTYPSLVSDLDTLRGVLQTAAHEWLHAYFFFRPLGQHIHNSEEMFTLNETAADLAGRELGDMAFARMGGDLSVSPSRYQSGEERDPIFTREMRKTRLRVEELLAQGEVEEAEQYMKERWWFLRLGGYRLRKLNQAYFALRGRYAEGPASVSPVGDQIKELRNLLPNVESFIKTISGVSSYQELLDLLESLGVQDEPDSVESSGAVSSSSLSITSRRVQRESA